MEYLFFVLLTVLQYLTYGVVILAVLGFLSLVAIQVFKVSKERLESEKSGVTPKPGHCW